METLQPNSVLKEIKAQRFGQRQLRVTQISGHGSMISSITVFSQMINFFYIIFTLKMGKGEVCLLCFSTECETSQTF